MKLRKMVSTILKAIGYTIGFLGVFFAFGSVGALENDAITTGQFFIQELTAFALIAIAVIVYIFRELFKYKYIENFYINK